MALSSSSSSSSVTWPSLTSRPQPRASKLLSPPLPLPNSVSVEPAASAAEALISAAVSVSSTAAQSSRWRTSVSFFPAFSIKPSKDRQSLKAEILDAIAPLDRGAEASSEDQESVDQIARKLEAVNPTKEPLKSDLLNGKWELIYTTSRSILQTERPKFLRSRVNYQVINVDTLRAQNMESWPFFNQVTADLTPLNARKVAVKFDFFKIVGLIPIKAPDRARGELEITYLDNELR